MAHSSPASIHVLTLTDVDCPCEQQPHHCSLRALSLSAPGPNYPNFQSMLKWTKAPSSVISFCRIDAEPKMVSALLTSTAAEQGSLFCSESVCGNTGPHSHGYTALGPELTPNQPCLSAGLAPQKPCRCALGKSWRRSCSQASSGCLGTRNPQLSCV